MNDQIREALIFARDTIEDIFPINYIDKCSREDALRVINEALAQDDTVVEISQSDS